MSRSPLPYRKQIFDWLRERIEGQSEVSLPDLKDAAVAYFDNNDEFLHALVHETLPSIVYQCAVQIMSQQRGQYIQVGDKFETRDAFKKRAQSVSRFVTWMEHAGGRHVQLLDMNKHDLLNAAKERKNRSFTELRYAKLWETMAAQLNEGELVRQRFTPEEIERMFESTDAA